MEKITIAFSEQTRQFLDHLIETGEYASIDDVVQTALHQFETRERQRTTWINARLQEGEDSGPGQPWDVEDFKARMHTAVDPS